MSPEIVALFLYRKKGAECCSVSLRKLGRGLAPV